MSFDVLSTRPLGRHLFEILNQLGKWSLAAPHELSLWSRGERTDLPREEIVRSASSSAFDYCHVVTSAGRLQVHWSYGPNARSQSISGTLTVSGSDAKQLRDLVLDLCSSWTAIYAYCDLKRVVDEDIKECNGQLFSEKGPYGVYWLNWFGKPFTMNPRIIEMLSSLGQVNISECGARGVVLTDQPGEANTERIRALASAWPIFRKYNPQARMRAPLAIDYGEVRALNAASTTLGSISSLVGDVDTFLKSVQRHADYFRNWAMREGLRTEREEDFKRSLREVRGVIEDERNLLLGAIAAYGELIRSISGGEWKKSIVSGEPVVGRFARPWSNRRVVMEVLNALHPSD